LCQPREKEFGFLFIFLITLTIESILNQDSGRLFQTMNKNAIRKENLRIALQSIRTNKLRAILTMFIIAFGIMALVGILTAIEAIRDVINNQFTSLGANTFSISSQDKHVTFGGHRQRVKNFNFISYKQAERFKQEFKFPATVSVSVNATYTGTIKYKSEKTNPNIPVFGTDENYLSISGYEIGKGRFFSSHEIELNSNYAVIGSEIVKKIFKTDDPIDKIITVGSGKYKVIGVLKEKGSSMSGSGDKICLLTHSNVRQYFSVPEMSYTINILIADQKLLDIAIDEAEGLFRTIRGLKASDATDFTLTASNSIANMMIKNSSYVTIAATIIEIITLFGAAIGLMNIMLVSVTERTTEIGIRKALGAKTNTIKQQFLFEAVIIGQFGGFLGIFLGILFGNFVALIMGAHFIIPWFWILCGIVECFLVGILSGYVPAMKAARVDPIISLRYE
jgi:putative ABC transport system permease protein